MANIKLLAQVIRDAGRGPAVAKACGITTRAVYNWQDDGMPRTEYTGETNYTNILIEQALRRSHRRYSRSDILPLKREYLISEDEN